MNTATKARPSTSVEGRAYALPTLHFRVLRYGGCPVARPWLVQVTSGGGAIVTTSVHNTHPEAITWIDRYLDDVLRECTESYRLRVTRNVDAQLAATIRDILA